MKRVKFFLIDEEFYFCYGRIVRGGTSGCHLSCEICKFKEVIPLENLIIIYQDKFRGTKLNFYIKGRLETLLEEYGKKIDIKKTPLLKETVFTALEFCKDGKGYEIQKKAVFPNGKVPKGNKEISFDSLDVRLNLEKSFRDLK